jgi:hypothetical protein
VAVQRVLVAGDEARVEFALARQDAPDQFRVGGVRLHGWIARVSA